MPNNTEQWRWLWRLNIPQRCKIFLWLALNDRLPTNNSSKSPPFITDPVSSSCPFCHGQETLLHLLRDCTRAKNTWTRLVAPHHQRGFFSCSMWDWMVTYLQQPWSSVNYDCSNAMDKDGALFAATVWLLWKDRKSWVCDGRSVSSERLVQRLGALAEDYGRVVQVECCKQPDPAVRFVSWSFYWNQPPSQGQVNLVAENSQVVLPKL